TTPDWTTYHSHQQRHRIPLPTYPFQHKHYWLDRQATTARATGGTAARRDDITQWFYAPSWQRAPLPAGEQPDCTRHWLVFADGLGVGEAVSEQLRTAGATVTLVAAAGAWSDHGDNRYAIDPADSSDYERLISTLRSGPAGVPTHIVHGWSVTAPGEEGSLQHGFESLIRLTQALVQHPDSEPRRIWVLSNGLHNVTGAEPLSPLKATLLGPCRVLPRELPGTTCRSVDLDCQEAPNRSQLVNLMAELAAAPEPGTETVAHRGGHRWSQHFLPQPLPRGDRSPAVRKDGVYLVTGGTGGLGLALAGHLAAAGARIALTARTRLPDAAEWDSWLAHNPGKGRLADTVRELVRLRDAGAELLVLQADVSDQAAMSEAVRRTTQRWGAVHGAFHTAGVAGGGLIQLKDLQAAAEVLLPKVRGTLVLEEVLADQELDFLVLFGSNGANIGSVGQVDYCAANCFLDAFAQDRGRTRRVISIDWGPWREIGMAADTAAPSGIEQVDQRAMSAAEGLWALDAILAGVSESQVVVSPAELSALFENAFSLEQGATAEPRGGAHERPDILTEFVAPRSDTERAICEVWQELLGIEKVGIQDSFFDLGGNSLIAIQLVSTTNTRLGTKLALGDLYEGLTAAHLAGLVEKPVRQATSNSLKELEERREKMQQRRRQHQQRRRTARGE
ncbi:SDR family NAD(P)-dependent oxidoreductase, partial [Kitasatospora sp. NPDC005856]|uniref:SDR family NAD(P)-dependent oxidoreductase n=1 Tax=Kitasatospora sp. NPDC005856 TaxID=3154566 RepID=UPI0033F990B5